MSEFSFLVFKINFINYRLAVLENNIVDEDNDLLNAELSSLRLYLSYLSQKALNILASEPYVPLVATFFDDNDSLFKDALERKKNSSVLFSLVGRLV